MHLGDRSIAFHGYLQDVDHLCSAGTSSSGHPRLIQLEVAGGGCSHLAELRQGREVLSVERLSFDREQAQGLLTAF